MLKEILRVLKPSGFCILRTPNALRVDIEVALFHRSMNEEVFSYLTPGVLDMLIRDLGGKVVWMNLGCRVPPLKPILCKFIVDDGI